jgi:uncharacterized protein (DUF305 family)
MKNTNILYGVIGVLVGVIIVGGVCMAGRYHGKGDYSKNDSMMMHKMYNGTMMSDSDMSMQSMMISMMASLEGKTGDEFDKAFLSEMVVHHQGAVEMAKVVLATSKKPELVKLANDIISAQNKEIEMMQGWQKAWFK